MCEGEFIVKHSTSSVDTAAWYVYITVYNNCQLIKHVFFAIYICMSICSIWIILVDSEFEKYDIKIYFFSFYQAREFWRLLSWPNQNHALQLLDALCAAALHYADLIHQRLADSGYYDIVGTWRWTWHPFRKVSSMHETIK